MFNTQYEQPAVVLLWAMWGLAALLVAVAAGVSARHASTAAPATQPVRLAAAKSVESVTRPSMLRGPRHAISKDKLD